MNMLMNVRSELFEYTFEKGSWSHRQVDTPPNGTIQLGGQDEHSNRYFFYYEGFVKPRSLFFVGEGNSAPVVVKSLPDFFDSE